MTPELAEEARGGMTGDGKWLSKALDVLREEGWIKEVGGGKLKCEPRSFKVGWGD